MTADHEQEQEGTVEVSDAAREGVARYMGMARAQEISMYNTMEGTVESLKRELQFGMEMGDQTVGMGYTMGLVHGMACKCVHLYGMKRGVAVFNNVLRRPIEEILGGMTGSVVVSETFIEDAIDMGELARDSEDMDAGVAAFFADREIARDELDNPNPEDEV